MKYIDIVQYLFMYDYYNSSYLFIDVDEDIVTQATNPIERSIQVAVS
jgi:hypothetical protein